MDELGKSLPGAEGMVEAEQSGKGKHNEFCLNCGTKLTDTYCPHCGQKDLPRRQTLGELWVNFISSFFSFEGKFFRTAKFMILKPGFLAVEYNTGRRESYYHPARMYVFVSFIFFLIFFSLPDDNKVGQSSDNTELSDEDLKELKRSPADIKKELAGYGVDTSTFEIDSAMLGLKRKDTTAVAKEKKTRFNYGLSKADYATVREYDSAQAALPENKRDGWLTRRVTIRSIELNARYGDKPGEFGNDFWKASLENFSTLLFFLLPVFALLLKLLYVRRNYFYSEHLVFSIYYYNFFYFAGSILMLVGLIKSVDWLTTIMGWGIYLYLLISMKRVYGQSWGKTIAKFLLFSISFMFCFFLAFATNLFIIMMVL